MVLTDDEQAIETKHLGFTISPARGVRRRGGRAHRRGAGRRGGRAHARAAGGGGAAARVHGARRRPRDPPRQRTEEWDAQATAAALVEAIRAEEPFDLIVFGNESADAGNYQVGIRVAYALGLPVVTGLKGLTVADGRARCEQEVAGGPRRLRRAAAGRRDGEGGAEPAALSVGAGEAAREPQAGRRAPRRAARAAAREAAASSCRRASASRPRCSATARMRRPPSSR